jgi:ATPase family associated with various cellular activities (AAA)
MIRQRFPLARLDAALAREVLRLRVRYQLSLDEFRGLYVSDEQVDALLNRAPTLPPEWAALPGRQPHPAIDALRVAFGLDDAAIDVLLLALAPDLDPAYATLIAYLNDDVRRRWPTADLARRLFGDTAALDPAGPLVVPGLLLPIETTERLAAPLSEFAPNPVLTAHLTGAGLASNRGLAQQPEVAADPGPLAGLLPLLEAGHRPLVLLIGSRADNRTALVRTLNSSVVHVDLSADAPARFRDGILAARLNNALVLLEPDVATLGAITPLLRAAPVPVFLKLPDDAAWRPLLSGLPAIEIAFAPPDATARRAIWADSLDRAGVRSDPAAVAEVADRFRLSRQQIEAAAASLRTSAGAEPGRPPDRTAMLSAARHQASAELSGLAQRLDSTHTWADLVLPNATMRQLRHLAGAIRHRERVFGDWGFGGGPGVTALFSGGPGTGKSMSAGVLAHEAGLDLWRIDLSSVVSKYIGETEKHLDRIFALARDGNAILFFDEADALFGKRSEVKDAHDRYANIEVAFLLQRLEAFDGVVILASNLARNVDPAFSRRMHVVIEFALPDAALRERLWRACFPPRSPLADDVDFGFLAAQFAFAGGDIRVAALDAAFAAAGDDTAIDMPRLLRAVSRQLLKQGKVPTGSDFRQYQGMLAETRMAAE